MSSPVIYDVPIVDVLKRHGVSREQFAEAGGIVLSTFRAYARGHRVPSAAVVMAAERALNIPRHELRPDLWPPPSRRKSSCRKAA